MAAIFSVLYPRTVPGGKRMAGRVLIEGHPIGGVELLELFPPHNIAPALACPRQTNEQEEA